jgi:uncharacterized protein (TIGR00730 family)
MSLTDLVREVDEWLKGEPASANQDLLAELLYMVLDLAKQDFDRGDLKVLVRSLREMRRAFRLFAPFRSVRKVSIFGSARVAEGDPYYALAVEFSRRIAEEGFMVITGAGEGIMQAGHEGAGRAKSIGVNIKLPFEQRSNPYITPGLNFLFKYFFMRKLWFAYLAKALIVFPGGFGTFDELFEALTLIQTQKVKHFPVILVDRAYWSGLIDWTRETLLAEGKIDPEDLKLLVCTDDPAEVEQLIVDSFREHAAEIPLRSEAPRRETSPRDGAKPTRAH